MKIKDLNIATQLRIGFGFILFAIIVLGVISWKQTDKMADQASGLYENSLEVRRAIGALRSDVYMIHWGLETVFLQDNYEAMIPFIEEIGLYEASAHRHFDLLYERYTGLKKDIDDLYEIFLGCKSNREIVIDLIRAGNHEMAMKVNIHEESAITGDHLAEIIEKITVIDDFTRKRSDQFFHNTVQLNRSLGYQLIYFLVAVLIIISLIVFTLIKNINNPLTQLTEATRMFKEGKTDARSAYWSPNEFGLLSESFNELAETIESELKLHSRSNEISSIMLSEDEAQRFCQELLKSLTKHTLAQMSAVYFLNDDKTEFEPFECIGLDTKACNSFPAKHPEGEFGVAIASGKMQHIKDIPDDTRFTFSTVSGKFKPREIITIPIMAGDETVAVISLATITSFSKNSLLLLDRILNTLNARMIGILAYRKLIAFSKQLENQNLELDIQKKELSAQAHELSGQNIELEMQKKQLDEANRLKTTFLSNMSHELRTPLNSVIALTGVLSRRLSGKIQDEDFSYLEVIGRNGKHLLDLINDILDISRIESGREELEFTNFNLTNLIDELIAMFEPQAQEKGIALLQQALKKPAFATNDAGKIRHILQNLIGNAIKFTETGSVKISIKQVDDNFEIQVADTGIGISEEVISYIFDEFRQADGSISQKYDGTGLGLSIAQKYARLVGGDITVSSTPGKGSVFTLKMPVDFHDDKKSHGIEKDTPVEVAAFAPRKQNAEQRNAKTILLVEDSEPAIIQMKHILEGSGYKVKVANNGIEAIELISGSLPDAIILDLMMPEVDGFEVLKMLRKDTHTVKIPVLILSAKHISKNELKFLKENNIAQLIQKGNVNLDELLKAVDRMVFPIAQKRMEASLKKFVRKENPLVLVVEDNPDRLITAKAVLAGQFEVIEAVDGKEAVSMAKVHKPDLILMDIALPEMDGIEAFKIIRGDPNLKYIPIIALTASAMTGDREVILAHGFDGYIAKPIDEKEFFGTIKAVLYG
jgi:signal transduction histidine kinase/DNA-binding response OmpR family regulator/HAMP domain-containing protein